MAFTEERQLPVLALAVAMGVILWSLYLEMRRRREHAENIRRKKNSNKQRVARDYEAIEGSALLEKFRDYKARCEGKNTKYWEDYIANQPEDLKNARRKLKKFWERTVDAFNAGNLPDNFFSRGSDWLQSGQNYRMIVEPIDIANYYNLGLWKESKHYLEDNNRPHAYALVEEKWAKAYGPKDSVQLARDMQRRGRVDVQASSTSLRAGGSNSPQSPLPHLWLHSG